MILTPENISILLPELNLYKIRLIKKLIAQVKQVELERTINAISTDKYSGNIEGYNDKRNAELVKEIESYDDN